MGPGFDCLGMAIDMYNVIEAEEIDKGLEIIVPEAERKYIPTDESNLVYASMKYIFDLLGIYPRGVRLNLKSDIPVTRGLGSSAACIVGGIAAANLMSGGKLSKDELIRIAAKIDGHPDNVLPAIVGGMTVACMDEEKVVYVRISPPRNLRLAVMIPEFQLPTSKAREILPQKVPIQDAVFNISRAALMTASMLTGQLDHLMTAVEDRLHQPYRQSLIPHWDEMLEGAKKFGAKGVFLSGAGPTIIAIIDESNVEFQENMLSYTSSFKENWDIRIVDFCESGMESQIL